VRALRQVKAFQALLLALAVMVATSTPASAATIDDPLGKVKVAHPWYGWAGYLFAVLAILTLVGALLMYAKKYLGPKYRGR
jgi:carbon starvation protein CstA